ncbi:GNAT family N-acetyltransferase [Massilia niastensis]|uniref:GNAT family N-acetyltransferase n=1 Tax=Massilia niastensis TaxID=544911 RepID=UPI000368A6BB|nr:N-acetyltransferase [Massilia niastensis]
MIELHIRPELPADIAAIDAVERAAFASHPHSNQTEHLIVERLRGRGRLTLSLAALEGSGRLVGHIAFSPVTIDGQDHGWYGLGPLAVLPQAQGRGVGTALVEAGLACLRRRGARGCVLVGEPGYYGRFGFAPLASLRYPGLPPEYFLSLAFAEPAPAGVVAYDEAFA